MSEPTMVVGETSGGPGTGPSTGARAPAPTDEGTVIVGESGGGDGDTRPSPGDTGPRDEPGRPLDRPFGRYRLVRLLGAGGMGVVYEAVEPELGRTVALKVLREDVAKDDDLRARFHREAQLAARLRHPHAVPIHDVGEVAGTPYFTMAHVAGRTLAERMAESRAARPGEAPDAGRLRREVGWLADVAAAVGHAHAQGVVHRDLKPANVIVDAAEKPWVTDFGLARDVSAGKPASHGRTHTGAVLGTPAYMSPEQALAIPSRIGAPTDVWALGIMLYEILAGRTPFTRAETVWDLLDAIAKVEPALPRTHDPSAPADLEAVCLRSLEKDPAARYPHAGAFEAELRAWLDHRPVSARLPGRLDRMRRGLGRHRRAALGMAAALVLATAAVGVGSAARRADRERIETALATIAQEVAALEIALLRTPVPEEGRAQLSRQPLDVLEWLIRERPDLGVAYAWRGRLSGVLGHAEAADADFVRAAELSPADPRVRFLRGMRGLDRYAAARSPRPWTSNTTRFRFGYERPETEAECAEREAALADLAAALAAPDPGPPVSGEGARTAAGLAALFAGQSGDAERALGLLDGIDTPAAARWRGHALLRLGRFAEAETVYARALERWPEDLQARATRACVLCAAALAEEASGGDPRPRVRAALAECHAVLERVPEEPFALQTAANATSMLANAQAARGEDPRATFREAIALYGRGLQGTGPREQLLAGRAGAWIRLGDEERLRGEDPGASFRRAVEDGELARRAAPQDVGHQSNLALALGRCGDEEARAGRDPSPLLSRALAELDEGRRLAPRDAALAANRGLLLRSLAAAERNRGGDARGTYARAIADLEAAAALEPGDAILHDFLCEVRAERALAEGERGGDARAELERAIADGDAALRIRPDFARALANRGDAHRRLGEGIEARRGDGREHYRAALADLDRALAVAPGEVATHSRRGSTWADVASSQEVRREDPSDALRRAVADFDAVLARTPTDLPALNNRGNANTRIGQVEEARGQDPQPAWSRAIEDFDRAIRCRPDHAVPYVGRGSVLRLLAVWKTRRGESAVEDWARAESDYVRALARGGSPLALLHLGLVYRAQGRLEEALRAFEQGLRAAPEHAAWTQQRIEETRKQLEAARPR